MRPEFKIISQWIPEHAHVLDLGCGNGALLAHLQQQKHITGIGIEIDPDDINACIEKGLTIIEQDINQGLSNFADDLFDVVIMSLTLQTMKRPDHVLNEILRIGKQAIVVFPNFAHWRSRWHLWAKGRMPVATFMPYQWYDTPNIHFCTIYDFEALCQTNGISLRNHAYFQSKKNLPSILDPFRNILCSQAMYHLARTAD